METVRQANFLLPEELLEELRRLVPRGEQSRVVSEAIALELKRRTLTRALKESFGAWGSRKDLKSTRGYVRRLRKERKH